MSRSLTTFIVLCLGTLLVDARSQHDLRWGQVQPTGYALCVGSLQNPLRSIYHEMDDDRFKGAEDESDVVGPVDVDDDSSDDLSHSGNDTSSSSSSSPPPRHRLSADGDHCTWPSLSSLERDAERLCGLLRQKGLATEVKIGYAQSRDMAHSPISHFPMLSRAEVLKSLKDMFAAGRHDDHPLFYFSYTGHGDDGTKKPTEIKGALVFQRKLTKSELKNVPDWIGSVAEHVTFEDLLSVWQNARRSLKPSARFVIQVDACYSGKLVQKLRRVCRLHPKLCKPHSMDNINMAIQSAGDQYQSVMERSSIHKGRVWNDGELTAWWLARNEKGTKPGQVHYSSLRDHPQWPQYFATWASDKGKSWHGPVHDLVDYVPEGLYFMQKMRHPTHHSKTSEVPSEATDVGVLDDVTSESEEEEEEEAKVEASSSHRSHHVRKSKQAETAEVKVASSPISAGSAPRWPFISSVV